MQEVWTQLHHQRMEKLYVIEQIGRKAPNTHFKQDRSAARLVKWME